MFNSYVECEFQKIPLTVAVSLQCFVLLLCAVALKIGWLVRADCPAARSDGWLRWKRWRRGSIEVQEKRVRRYEVKIVYQERDAGEYDGHSKKSRRWIMQEISDVEEWEVDG